MVDPLPEAPDVVHLWSLGFLGRKFSCSKTNLKSVGPFTEAAVGRLGISEIIPMASAIANDAHGLRDCPLAVLCGNATAAPACLRRPCAGRGGEVKRGGDMAAVGAHR